MKATITTLLVASVLISGLASLSTPAAAKRKQVYAYAPYGYVPVAPAPYAVGPNGYGPAYGSGPSFAYTTYSGGFSPFPYSDGFGAYARNSFGVVPRGFGYYGYGPDPDSTSGYGPFFGTNPWWRAMGRFGMDGRPQ
jgi:hypothetical protein